MGDSSRREALARNLCARVMRLAVEGQDEIDVIDGFVLRLELGFNNHGPLDLRRDARDWTAETDEELADVGVYRAFKRTSKRFAEVDRIEAGLDELETTTPVVKEPAVNFTFDMTDVDGAEG